MLVVLVSGAGTVVLVSGAGQWCWSEVLGQCVSRFCLLVIVNETEAGVFKNSFIVETGTEF